MGKVQKRLLKFALEYPTWHTCGQDSKPAMRRLQAMGLLEVSGDQFRIRLGKEARAMPDFAATRYRS